MDWARISERGGAAIVAIACGQQRVEQLEILGFLLLAQFGIGGSLASSGRLAVPAALLALPDAFRVLGDDGRRHKMPGLSKYPPAEPGALV